MSEAYAETVAQRGRVFSIPPIVLGASLFLVSGAVNLPAPLYPTYAALSGYGTGGATIAFAAYVLGLVPVLLLLGGCRTGSGAK